MDDLLFGTIANDIIEPGPGLLVFSGAGMDLIDAAAGGGLGSRLYGGSGNDEIILDIDGRGFGSGGNDKLESAPSEENAGGNRLYGGPGDDQLTATYNDRLFGGSGNDILDVTGDGSENRLYGGAGDDTLTAGTGDRLVGQDGNDLLIAAGGNSTLTGGAGADIFVAAPELPHLPNIITDFESGSDNIQLDSFVIENLAELLNQGTINPLEEGDGTVISIGDTPVFVLLGIEAGSLVENDFIFTGGNNTIENATDLGDLTDREVGDRGTVNDEDRIDFYQFQVGEESEVTVTLTGLTADANLALINDLNGNGQVDDGEAIAFSALEGTADEDIFAVLQEGSYFIRVRQQDDAGLARYDLTVSAEGTDSTLATANDLGDLTNSTVVETGSVRTGDGLDYYKFSVTLDSTVEINLNGLEGILTRLELIQDINGDGQVAVEEQLASVFLNSEDLVDGITSSIAVGEYFVLVELEQADTDYELTIDSQFRAADNSTATAVDLGDITNSSAADSDLVYDGDPRDFYQFEITEESEVTVNLTGLTGDANLALLDENGAAFAFSALGGTADEEIFDVLDAGNYFIRVRQQDDAGLARYDLTVSAQGTDSTLATANDLGDLTNNSVVETGSVRTGDGLDYYKFSVTLDSTVEINLNGLEGTFTRLELIQDVNGDGQVAVEEQLASVFLNSEDLVDGISQSIAVGEYFVLVQLEQGDTDYELTIDSQFRAVDNSTATAVDLGDITNSSAADSDLVYDGDPRDFYQFEITEESEVTVNLTGLTGDANLALLDENGAAFAFSALGGTADEEIFDVLDAGNYFIRVRQQDDAGLARYDLTVSAQGTDSTLATANDLGDLTNDSAVETGSVRTGDGLDYYQFSVDSISTVEINLDGLEGTLTRLELIEDIDGDGQVAVEEQLASVFLNSDDLVDGISELLPMGDYFVLVGLEEGDTDYELTIQSAIAPPDNSIETATDFGNITNNQAGASDLVNEEDRVDFYEFAITEESEVTVNLTGLTGDANLTLLDENGAAFAFSALEGTADEEIFQVLDAGNYFIRVRQQDDAGLARYDLTVSAEGTDSTLATANELGDLTNSTVVETGSVRTGDGLDYYKFSVTLDSTVEINLNGLEGTLTRLELIQDINGDGLVSVEEQLASVFLNNDNLVDGISESIAVGEYFVLVELEQADTNYELTIDSQFRAADNSPATAVDLGDITNSSAADSDLVYDGDPRDFYQFAITEESEVTVNLTGLTGDANLALIQDSDGDGEFDAVEAIAFSALEGTAHEEIFQVLGAGNYFIRVRQDDGEVAPGLARYDLSVAAEGTDSTLATANDLGILTGSFAPINDSVRTGDGLDYYKFEITENSTVVINLNGLEGTLTRLELIEDINGDGEVAVQEKLASVFLNSDNLVDGISQPIAVGEYFVLVGLEEGDTDYELTIAQA